MVKQFRDAGPDEIPRGTGVLAADEMPTAPGRRADCKATDAGGVIACDHCGLQWPADGAGPACAPMTFDRLRDRMIAECTRAEASVLAVRGLASRGLPTDGGAEAFRRQAELEAVLRLIDFVTADKPTRERLQGKGAR